MSASASVGVICRIIEEKKDNSEFAFPVGHGERILFAGLRAGLDLPYECASGSCGSCRATVVEGTTKSLWPQAPGCAKLRRPGTILMCQATCSENTVLSIQARQPAPPVRPSYMLGSLVKWRPLTPEISEFSIRVGKPVEFLAGQFCMIEFSGIEGPRAYSMIRPPGYDACELNFLIRDSGSGAVSKRLFRNDCNGHEVRIFGPLGRATFEAREERPFIAIAGGSGIAGILSIMEDAAAHSHFTKHKCHVVFGLRDIASSYLLDHLSSAVEASAGGLTVAVGLSEMSEDDCALPSHRCLRLARGFAHEVAKPAVEQATPSSLYYIAGPPVMVDATMRMLVIEKKVALKDIRYDRFG